MDDTYLVIGRIPSDANLMKRFNSFEEAVDFVNRQDALGLCWVHCPDGRWYHPRDDRWRPS